MHASESVANAQGLNSLPDPRFLRKLGQLPGEKLEAVKDAIRFALDL
jgi:mRNA-degrading endonuclease toxin of MazEF toxin-antitoxin module